MRVGNNSNVHEICLYLYKFVGGHEAARRLQYCYSTST